MTKKNKMDKVGYMVKYKNKGTWIGPYIGKYKKYYNEEELVYVTFGTAETEEQYVKMMTKKATKIVKVYVMTIIREIDPCEKDLLKRFEK
jgi:hypothetical protein